MNDWQNGPTSTETGAPALADAAERLVSATDGYETALAERWGHRTSYFVDGTITLARLQASSALDQFKRLAPHIERPIIVDVEARLRGPGYDALREDFQAKHRANVTALRAFLNDAAAQS